jgi:hypothetical protein
MNFWKLSALIFFGIVTGLCVSYAHSEGKKILEWKSSAWLGSCKLRAEKGPGVTWNFVATGYSKTRFASVWPDVAGELFLSSGQKQSQYIGVEPLPPDETLTIRFGLVNGKTTPLSYEYDNVKNRLATQGLVQPMGCPLQN